MYFRRGGRSDELALLIVLEIKANPHVVMANCASGAGPAWPRIMKCLIATVQNMTHNKVFQFQIFCKTSIDIHSGNSWPQIFESKVGVNSSVTQRKCLVCQSDHTY